MFICQHTGELIGPNIKQNKVVLEKRIKTYQKPIMRYGKVINWVDVTGWEIVKEISVGPEGYKALTGQVPIQVSTIYHGNKMEKENTRLVEPWRFNRFDKKKPSQQKKTRLPVIEVIETRKR